jgi:hypothetical protein
MYNLDKKDKKDLVYIIGILLAAILLSYIVVTGIFWVLCWSFGLEFTFKLSIGFYLTWIILAGLFSPIGKKQ